MSQWDLYGGSDETGADLLINAIMGFLGCVSLAVPDICSTGWTIGDQYVPFNPDPDDECDDEEAMCSQLWVRVTNITPDASQGWEGDCAVTLQIGLEVGILRCVPIPEEGEAPTSTEVLVEAMQSMEDMNKIFCAAMGCEVWESIVVGDWNPVGPLGGQYGGIWTFTAEL